MAFDQISTTPLISWYKLVDAMEYSPEDVIAEAVEPFAFKKGRKNHWYRDYSEVTQIVALQKSKWGPQYGLNLAIWLKDLGEEERPLCHKSHIQNRLGLFSEHGNLVDSALDFEDGWKWNLRNAVGFCSRSCSMPSRISLRD